MHELCRVGDLNPDLSYVGILKFFDISKYFSRNLFHFKKEEEQHIKILPSLMFGWLQETLCNNWDKKTYRGGQCCRPKDGQKRGRTDLGGERWSFIECFAFQTKCSFDLAKNSSNKRPVAQFESLYQVHNLEILIETDVCSIITSKYFGTPLPGFRIRLDPVFLPGSGSDLRRKIMQIVIQKLFI